MKIAYKFAVLRYIHDPITQEFANIGLVVFSAEAQFLAAICEPNYGRLSRMFVKVDGGKFKELTRYIQSRIKTIGEELDAGLGSRLKQSFELLLAQIVPPDDTSYAFASAGIGFSEDLSLTLQDLYGRYVAKYSGLAKAGPKTDEDVWRVFRANFQEFDVIKKLKPKVITGTDFKYNFKHAWKNAAWHLYEPMSFDMRDEEDMLNKAHRWVGRAASLNDSSERWKMHVLLGEPSDSKLRKSFIKAENILHKMPGQHEFVREEEAKQFAEQVASQIETDG